VVADYFSVAFLQTLHGVAGSPAEAAAAALAAGIDVELPTVSCFGAPLVAAVGDGSVDERLVDRALTRVLLQKCELGLLDPGLDPEPDVPDDSTALDDEETRSVARELARRSVVLLANDGTLPLRPGQRVAVVGPRADDARAMLGCYSFPMHVGVHHPHVPLGVSIPTFAEAIAQDPAGYRLTVEPGCPVLGGDDAGIARAAEAARSADVCVAVLGDRAGLFGAGTSGEGCDAVDLRLPGRQEELLEALLSTGTPVVLVLLVGRPYDLSRQLDRLGAAVCGFFPGEEGATALADVLGGRVNPSGRLPVGFPGAGANQPGTYLSAPLGGPSDVSVVDPTPVFPFGHGLTYAPLTWTAVELLSGADWPTDGTCELAVSLSNESRLASSEVVQVYLRDPVAEVTRPAQQLVAARRVDLEPGGRARVVLRLHADLASFTGRAGARVVDPGEVELRVGASSTDTRRTLRLQMTGKRRHPGRDRHLQPETFVEPSAATMVP
jgi:beta-xylosidase